MTREVSHFLNQAIKMIIAEGKAGTVDDFAAMVGETHNVIANIMTGRTAPSYGQYLSIVDKIRELSPNYAYKLFKIQILGEIEQ